jgi:15-cis-phytoene synthase
MSSPRAQLSAAYGVCRSITRAAARNFYYAFLVLPGDRRDALCAVYAFMRHADDISDDPSLPAAEKQQKLQAWLDGWNAVLGGHPTDDPVLFALADAQKHFDIPPTWLEQLVHGTAVDAQGAPGELVTYRTFDDLYRYCYGVASVVGLVTIKVMGYRDPRAEKLAEDTGVAFQLTNILRDVKEDAALGRVYLPEEDLAKFGRTPADLHPANLNNGFDPQRFKPVLELHAQRARELYRAGDELLPLVDEDSRPALWVLLTIYRRLLGKIEQRGYDVVFRERVTLTAREKLTVFAQGFWRRLT